MSSLRIRMPQLGTGVAGVTLSPYGDIVYTKARGRWSKRLLYVKVQGTWRRTKTFTKVSGTWK